LQGHVRSVKLHAIDCTPCQLRLLMAAGLTNGSGCSPLTVLVGGEPIDEKLWNLLVADKANVFYNLYTFSALSKLFDLISCYTRSKS
jgi:hypothetical protein